MATVLKKCTKELDGIDQEDFITSIEEHAATVEHNFISFFSSGQNMARAAFTGSDQPICTFDFESN